MRGCDLTVFQDSARFYPVFDVCSFRLAFGEGGQAITFMGWERELSGEVLRRFAVAGMIHNSSYLGVVVGLAVAIFVAKRRKNTKFDSYVHDLKEITDN